jgi:hypothetical protein
MKTVNSSAATNMKISIPRSGVYPVTRHLAKKLKTGGGAHCSAAAAASIAGSSIKKVPDCSSGARAYSQSQLRSSPNDQAEPLSSSSIKSSPFSSKRGRLAVNLLPSYLADARACQVYNKDTCPNGALQLGVAESQIMAEDWLVPALNTMPELQADAIYYQPTPGRADFKQAMASYIEEMADLPQGRLQLDGLVVGAGCNAVLENMCFTLAEAGDAVLILPTPYYAAFEFDLVARAGLTVEPVQTMQYQQNVTRRCGTVLSHDSFIGCCVSTGQ